MFKSKYLIFLILPPLSHVLNCSAYKSFQTLCTKKKYNVFLLPLRFWCLVVGKKTNKTVPFYGVRNSTTQTKCIKTLKVVIFSFILTLTLLITIDITHAFFIFKNIFLWFLLYFKVVASSCLMFKVYCWFCLNEIWSKCVTTSLKYKHAVMELNF